MGGFALDTIGAYPELLPEVRTTLDGEGLRILLEHRRPLLPATHQNTTNEDKTTDRRSSSEGQLLHQEQGDEVREQEIHKVELAFVKDTPNEERPEAKAPVESDKSKISDVDWETSGYSFYRPLNISKKDLQDKSKANGLAKALVCLQASWFCVQCLVRVRQALPVTLLEINTFAHSICALLVYILWWNKPLDVEQPTYLPVRGVDAVSRWLDISRPNYSHTTRFIEYPYVIYSELKDKLFTARSPMREEHVRVLKPLWHRDEFLKEVPSEFKKFMSEAEAVKLDLIAYPGLLIHDGGTYGAEQWGTWWPYPDRNLPSCMSYSYKVCTRSDASHWEFPPGFVGKKGIIGVETVVLNRRSTRKTRVRNWPSFDIRKPWIQLLFLFVAFLYGGLHSLAWNALFPSPTERLLWQTSSSLIMGAGVLALICYFLSERTFGLDNDPYNSPCTRRWRIWTFRLSKPILNYRLYGILGKREVRHLLYWIQQWRVENDISPLPIIWKGRPFLYGFIDILLVGIISLLLPAYIFARIYLVVESFIQLFHLEPGPVFEQPLWSSYIPHLG